MPAIIAIGAMYGLSGAAAAGAGIATVAAGAKVATDLYSTHKQVQAAEHATDVNAAANDKALAFSKEQAAADQARFEATQRANYDQWAAKQRASNSLRAIAGLGPVDIPAYVPTTGQPPAPGAPNTSAPAGNPQLDLVKAATAKGLTGQAAVDYINSQQPGSAVVWRAGAPGMPTNQVVWYDKGNGQGKFQYGNQWEYKIDPALGPGWQFNAFGAPSTAAPTAQPGSLRALLYPNVAAPPPIAPRTPALYQPGSLASFAYGA